MTAIHCGSTWPPDVAVMIDDIERAVDNLVTRGVRIDT